MKAALAIAPTDVQVIYRAAVVDALAGRTDSALKNLSNAIVNGFSRRNAQDDEDFRTLRHLPEFKQLIAVE